MLAMAALERYVDPVLGILAGHGFSVGECRANITHDATSTGVSHFP
jgi:hypothetical protein